MNKEAADLVKALDKAWEMKLTDKSLNFNDKFMVVPQVTTGKSTWAQWVKEEVLTSFDILWAFRDTEPKQWLGIRIHLPFEDFTFSQKPKKDKPSGGDTFYFNLQVSTDRWRLKELENELKAFLKKTPFSN